MVIAHLLITGTSGESPRKQLRRRGDGGRRSGGGRRTGKLGQSAEGRFLWAKSCTRLLATRGGGSKEDPVSAGRRSRSSREVANQAVMRDFKCFVVGFISVQGEGQSCESGSWTVSFEPAWPDSFVSCSWSASQITPGSRADGKTWTVHTPSNRPP